MPPRAFLQKRIVSIMDTLVRAVVEEMCVLGDVSALKASHGATCGGGEEEEVKVMTVTAALEKLTREAAEQISELFHRLGGAAPPRAPPRAPLSFTQRQKMKRKYRRSSVKSTDHSSTTVTTNEEKAQDEKDFLSQAECVSGEMDPLYSPGDPTLNTPEDVEAAHAQHHPGLKVELGHEKAAVNCSTQHQEQKEEALHDQPESALPDLSLPSSSDALETKASAAPSSDLSPAPVENGGSCKQEASENAGEPSGRNRRRTTAQNVITCEACGKTFTYLNNLKRHEKTFHSRDAPHACNDCGERFSSRRLLRVHLREHRAERPHACSLCEKVFRLPNHLRKHMSTHTNERPFTCTTCGKSFTLMSTLRAHERTHSGQKTFVCVCGMSFLTKSYLDYHQRVHTGEKPYTCVHCGKTFAQKSNLRVHERLHTGEKPFRCQDCGQSFAHANSYKSHQQLHTGVKAFCCEHCGKGFRRGTHLKTHLLTHSGEKPFQCDLCPKTFALKGSLKAHRLTHTGEKSFICNICSKGFTQASSLGKHRRTHTGEKPYLCSFCSKSFCQSSHLHYHYRASHPGAVSLAEAIDMI